MDQLLDVDDLINENKRQEGNRLDVFESVLVSCHGLIKRNNKERIREMFYTIPTFIPGKPKYNIDTLRNYIIYHLEDNGLKVEILDRYHIYISWKETDINLEKYLKRKTLVTNRKISIYNIDETNPFSQLKEANGQPSRLEMLKFRQERQRELQEERQQRFQIQKMRMPVPNMDYRNYVKRF